MSTFNLSASDRQIILPPVAPRKRSAASRLSKAMNFQKVVNSGSKYSENRMLGMFAAGLAARPQVGKHFFGFHASTDIK
jgi:hypothetical protein